MASEICLDISGNLSGTSPSTECPSAFHVEYLCLGSQPESASILYIEYWEIEKCCSDTLDVQLQATLMSKFPGSIRGISITCRCHCGTNRMKFFPPVFAVVRIMKCDVYEMGRDMETLAFCNSLTRPSQAHPALVLRHTLTRFGCTIVERCKGRLRCTVKTKWCLE